MLDPNLPKTIQAQPRAVQKVTPPAPPLQERPQATHEPADEPPLRRQEVARHPLLEEADGAPGGADGAGDEQGHAQDGLGEAVEGGEGLFGEGLVAQEGEGGEDDGEEAGDGREGAQEEGEVCAEAAWVVRVERGAGEVCGARVGGRDDWGDFAECGWERRLFGGEEDGRYERWPFQARDFGERVDNLVGPGPGETGWIVVGPSVHVRPAVLHDEGAVAVGEAVTVEDEGVQELSCCGGHEEPGAEPPRSILEVAQVFEVVVGKFEGAGENVDGDGDAEL